MYTAMKRNIFRTAIVAFLLPMVACEKQLMDYQGLEGVYFAVQHGASYGNELNWPYQPYTNVEFVSIPDDEVTLQIKVMITGPVKDYDRSFRVEINPDSTTAEQGIHYDALQGELLIPANTVTALVPVTLKRTVDLQTEEKTIGLRLVANEHFGLSFPEWDAIPGYSAATTPAVSKFDASMHTIRISDFMVQPAIWYGSVRTDNSESGSWGAFSRKKIELMCEIMGLTYADFGSSDTMPTVLVLLISSQCTMYLTDRYNAGDPVLEDDGRLMWIGSVPWTSYLGVPWAPGS